MKVKRYTIETKIRILREAQSRDKTIQDVCRHIGLNRSTYAYRAKEADAWEAKLK